MERGKFYKQVEELNRNRIAISKKKSEDYANNEDVLSNFKRMSAAAQALNLDVKTPHGYALFMVLLKLDRFNNLAKDGKKPNFESLLDTVQDAHNYLDLSYACYIEGDK